MVTNMSWLPFLLFVPLSRSWAAYAFATAFHETAFTLQPVREYGGPRYFTKMYDITGSRPKLARANGNVNPGDGPRYCGRGYVQLIFRLDALC